MTRWAGNASTVHREHAVPSRLCIFHGVSNSFSWSIPMSKWWSTRPKKKVHLFNPNPRDRPKHANGREHANSSMFQFHCPSSIKVLLGAVTWGGWIFGGLFGMTARVMGRVASAVANGVPEKEWVTGTNLLVLWKKMTSWQVFLRALQFGDLLTDWNCLLMPQQDLDVAEGCKKQLRNPLYDLPSVYSIGDSTKPPQIPSRIFSLDASYAFRTTCVLAAMGRLRAMAARPLMLIPATPATPPTLWPLEERPRSWLWLWLVGATEGATKAQAARPLPTATESFDIDGIFCNGSMEVSR